MKTKTYTDEIGRRIMYAVPDEADDDFDPRDGLYLGPPLLDMDWITIGADVYNALVDLAVNTQEDVRANDGVITSVTKRIVAREILKNYLEAQNE